MPHSLGKIDDPEVIEAREFIQSGCFLSERSPCAFCLPVAAIGGTRFRERSKWTRHTWARAQVDALKKSWHGKGTVYTKARLSCNSMRRSCERVAIWRLRRSTRLSTMQMRRKRNWCSCAMTRG